MPDPGLLEGATPILSTTGIVLYVCILPFATSRAKAIAKARGWDWADGRGVAVCAALSFLGVIPFWLWEGAHAALGPGGWRDVLLTLDETVTKYMQLAAVAAFCATLGHTMLEGAAQKIGKAIVDAIGKLWRWVA